MAQKNTEPDGEVDQGHRGPVEKSQYLLESGQIQDNAIVSLIGTQRPTIKLSVIYLTF